MQESTPLGRGPIELRAPRFLITALLITIAADWLFYDTPPGASVVLFIPLLIAALLANRLRQAFDSFSLAMLLLLSGAAVQSIVEISFSNVLVLGALLVALMGQTFHQQLPRLWTRWVEALLGLLKSAGRWFWLLGELNRTERGLFRAMIWWTRAILPALMLAALFTLLLGFGNVIFGRWVNTAWETVLKEIVFPPFTRVLFWACVSTLVLAFLHPSLAPVARRMWFGKPPIPISTEAASLNSLRSVLILAVLNILFLAVNTIDACYLWMNATLPKGVIYSEFVHNGVYNLITCVLISALVLTFLFDQSKEAISLRWTKTLAFAWIAQNLFLIASVALRLKLYVDVYQLSVLRVYVAVFLLLVSAGFILLGIKILRDKSFHWLVLSNALATFVLFYAVQFLNVDGWVADYNVDRWIKHADKPLDVGYLSSLGPPAWPALRKAAVDPRGLPASLEARGSLNTALEIEHSANEHRSWKSWQWRRDALFREAGGANR